MSADDAKGWPCDDCGVHVVKRKRVDRAMLCTGCALLRVTLAAQQMHNRSGPAWDRWLASNGPAGRKPDPDERQ